MQRFASIAVIFSLLACGSSSLPPEPLTNAERNVAMLNEAKEQIKTGDIVLRCGKDMTSYKIREMSEKDKTYSHAGIAVVKPEGVFIYHLTPAELNEPEEDSVIRFERLDEFANPDKNFEFGIARFPLSSEEISKMISHLDSLRLQKVSFDFLFDLSTKNKMYCSEMIDDCIRFATHDSLNLKRNEFRNPQLVKKVSGYLKADTDVVRLRSYIPIENIYLHPACKMVAQYKFVNELDR